MSSLVSCQHRKMEIVNWVTTAADGCVHTADATVLSRRTLNMRVRCRTGAQLDGDCAVECDRLGVSISERNLYNRLHRVCCHLQMDFQVTSEV